ncbi:MAG: rod shape-determining protein MreD, partial [Chloroflexota bacterium]
MFKTVPGFAVFMAISFIAATEFQFFYILSAPYLESLKIPHAYIPITKSISQVAEIAALAVLVTLQASALWRFPIAGVKPDLVLVTVAVWSTRRGVREGTLAGFLAGLLLELYSGALFGTATAAMTVVPATARGTTVA